MWNRTIRKSSQVRKAGLLLLASALLLIALPLTALAQRLERGVDTWKPLHYDVAVAFNDQLTEFTTARTEITLQVISANLTRIDLDFGELPVDSVAVSGVPARFERKPERLSVMLEQAAKRGDKLNITVNYHGQPKDGLIFATDRDGNP
jgi:aminopeptidase N